jgi:glycosyltransferase involved in cell wall biosynthesis
VPRIYLFLGLKTNFFIVAKNNDLKYFKGMIGKKIKHLVFVNSVSPSVYGGGEKWYTLMAREFAAKGYKITLIARAESKLSEKFMAEGFDFIEFRFSFDFNPFRILALKKILRALEADVLFLNFNKDVSLAGVAGRLVGVKKILFINGFPLIQKKWKHKWLLPFFDLIISNTSALIKQYKTYNWGLEKKMVLVYNGISFKQFDDPKLNKNNIFTIFGAGRLTAVKNYSQFIHIVSVLHKEGFNIQAKIAGDGEELVKLKLLINELNAPVELVGEVPSIQPFLDEADVFLHCSSNEGMPTVLIEAMFSGVPCVATDVGGTIELIKDGVNGFLASFGDEEKLKNSIIKLYNNKDLREEIIKEGKLTYEHDFSLKESITKIENLFI